MTAYPQVKRILEIEIPNSDDLLPDLALKILNELLEAHDFLATDRGYLLCLVNRNHVQDDGDLDSRLILTEIAKQKIRQLFASALAS